MRAFFLLVLLVATGCGADFTQRVAGWYVTRQLDGYMDFTSDQKEAARARVDRTIVELRRTELPAWVNLLRKVRHGIHEGLTEDSVERLQRDFDARFDAAVALLTPGLAAMLADLSAAQLDHLAARLRHDVNKSFEDRSLPAAERRAKAEKRALETLEDWVGDLSDAQKDAVRGVLRSVPDDRPAMYRAGLRQIAQFHAFMATGPDAARIDAELRTMWAHRDDGLGAGRDRATREAEQRSALLAVSRLLDSEQRAHAEEEITERIRKIQRFMITE